MEKEALPLVTVLPAVVAGVLPCKAHHGKSRGPFSGYRAVLLYKLT